VTNHLSANRVARNNRREQLFIEQRHAWVHYYNRLGAADCSGYSMNFGSGVGKCPVCLKTTPFDDFDEEHAPQKSGVSTLGEATTIVLTCRACNGGAGRTYERDAAHPLVKQHVDLPGGCPAHGIRVDHSGPILQVVDEHPLVMADIKSAYILAFATLGYEWAVANGLKPIRAAIRSGDAPADDAVAIVGVDGSFAENSVIQFAGAKGGVAVVGQGGYAVLLPGPGSRRAPVLDGTPAKTRSWSWPQTVGPHGNVWAAREAGNLFHADFCDRHSW
jgi:hypothetical protein